MNTQVNFKDTDLLSVSHNLVWSKQIFPVLLTFYQYHQTHRGTLVKSVRWVSEKGHNDLIPLLSSTFKNFYWGIYHLNQQSKCLVWMYFMWLQCISCLLLLKVLIPVLPCINHRTWMKTSVSKRFFFGVCAHFQRTLSNAVTVSFCGLGRQSSQFNLQVLFFIMKELGHH